MKKQKPIKWLIKRSKKQAFKMGLLILSNAILSILSVVFAFIIKEIVDSATVHKDIYRLITFAMVILGIVVFQFAFRMVITCLTEHVRAKLEMEYRSYVFSKILDRKYEKISGYHSGELMNRLTADVSIVADGVSSILPTVVSALARLICAVIALVILDWIFAVAFTVAGLLVFITMSLLRGKLKSLHKSAQETEGKVRSFMQECIENMLAVKVFSINGKIEKQADQLQQENFKVKMRRKNYSAVGHATYNFIFSAGYLFALIYGCVMILDASLTYGSLSAILQLVNNVQVPFMSLSNVMPKYYSMVASAERLMDIEDIEAESNKKYVNAQDTYEKLKGISIRDLTFTYDRDKVLSNACFYINKGDFVMIEGSSGAGKSTLIKLMLGVYNTDSGEIALDLENKELPIDGSCRTLFSFVPQGNMIFSGTLRDNVTFINDKATDEEIDRALNISQASDFIDKLPNGLDTVVGENGVGLSEGQIQRIAIARAVLCNAPIILLDEATSALDEETERKVLDNLRGLENITLIIISHKKAAASICNRRMKIKNKQILEIQ